MCFAKLNAQNPLRTLPALIAFHLFLASIKVFELQHKKICVVTCLLFRPEPFVPLNSTLKFAINSIFTHAPRIPPKACKSRNAHTGSLMVGRISIRKKGGQEGPRRPNDRIWRQHPTMLKNEGEVKPGYSIEQNGLPYQNLGVQITYRKTGVPAGVVMSPCDWFTCREHLPGLPTQCGGRREGGGIVCGGDTKITVCSLLEKI